MAFYICTYRILASLHNRNHRSIYSGGPFSFRSMPRILWFTIEQSIVFYVMRFVSFNYGIIVTFLKLYFDVNY